MLIGLLLAGNLAGFGGSAAPVTAVPPSGGWQREFSDLPYVSRPTPEQVRLERLSWQSDTAHEVIAKAATEQRTKASGERHAAQMALLLAEFEALAQTQVLRDQARAQFEFMVSEESERQDACAAFMAMIVTMF